MQEHLHTGFPHVVFAGVSAILVIQVLRLVSSKLVTTQRGEPIGRVIGSLVTFS